jgi:hypothetical protein
MITQENIEQLKPFQARAIIEGLRKGLVPIEYVSFFTVGRQNWLRYVEDDLDHFVAQGGAKVRFINGDYGDGKTHFMSVIRQIALQKGFASSFVVLTRDVPIHKFEIIYQNIVAQIRGHFDGVGIRALIQSWLAEQQRANMDLVGLCQSLEQLEHLDSNFANALIGLLKMATSPEPAVEVEELNPQEILYQWFEGKKLRKKELGKFQVFETLTKNNGKTFLQSLVAFLRMTGHKGLILLFDELETVLAQSALIRNAAYENIRLLMDNTEHAQYLQIFFALIPDVLLAEKGFKSYDALWSRVRIIGDSDALNYRGTLIDLHKTPLKQEELVNLGMSLRKIHEISYRWNAEEFLPKQKISEICKKQEEMGVLSEVRLFIKQIIRYLDIAEQGDAADQFNISENLLASQKEMEVERMQQLEPAWDA